MVPHNIRSPNFLSSSSSHPLALTACWTMGNHLWLNSVWGMGNHFLSSISNCGVLVPRILDTSNSRLVVSAMGFTPARGRSSPVFCLGQEKGSFTLSCHALLRVVKEEGMAGVFPVVWTPWQRIRRHTSPYLAFPDEKATSTPRLRDVNNSTCSCDYKALRGPPWLHRFRSSTCGGCW